MKIYLQRIYSICYLYDKILVKKEGAMYSPKLSSAFNDTKNRSDFLSQSGMCSLCSETCMGTCEIGLAAVLGKRTVYPTNTGSNQVASEKIYPLDYSHFNINGRVFGALGTETSYEEASIFNVNLESSYGHPQVKLAMPIILPAVVKLNWPDYYKGAALAGVTCVIGEDARNKDENLKIENGKVTAFPKLKEMLACFNDYKRGYGQIVLQCNIEDHLLGVPEYAIKHCNLEALEFKFGQAAKGTQPVSKIDNYESAKLKQSLGILVHPDPLDPEIIDKYKQGICPNFYAYGRLPLWTEKSILDRISVLRDMGLKNVYFKMAGYDRKDIREVLEIASKAEVDMVTFDGAGGGSGYSPNKMMNEWGLPTVSLQQVVNQEVEALKALGKWIPAICITGGIVSEDQVFKALALGDGQVTAIGICRGAMTAAMTAKRIGQILDNQQMPKHLEKYNEEELFTDLNDLKSIYGKKAENFPKGAVGVYSYLNKIAFGLQHFMALNRKFKLEYINQTDLIPLTELAEKTLK